MLNALAHSTRWYIHIVFLFLCFLFDTQHQVSYFAYCCCSCLFWHTAPGDMHCLLFVFCSLCFCLAASTRCHSLLVVVVFASFWYCCFFFLSLCLAQSNQVIFIIVVVVVFVLFFMFLFGTQHKVSYFACCSCFVVWHPWHQVLLRQTYSSHTWTKITPSALRVMSWFFDLWIYAAVTNFNGPSLQDATFRPAVIVFLLGKSSSGEETSSTTTVYILHQNCKVPEFESKSNL